MGLSNGIGLVRRKASAKFSLSAKMNCLILLLFVPIIIMYSYSNDVAFNVVSKELQMSNARQLAFLSNQIDSRINQMMDFTITFSRDPNVQKFNGLALWEDRYDRMQTRYVIQEKMRLQSGITSIWPAKYTVYSQQNKEMVSNANDARAYDEEYLKQNMSGKWTYGDGTSIAADQKKDFYWFYSDSTGQQGTLTGSNLVVSARFGHENIQNMLDTYKAGGQGDPFFYHKGESLITNRTADNVLMNEVQQYLDTKTLENTTQQIAQLNGKDYLVMSNKSPYLNWHLVDVVPLDRVLGPIEFSRNLFYVSLGLLFAVGLSVSFLLYRNVQRPIQKLIHGLKRVQRGDYSVRISSNDNNEFTFLFRRFNDMSRQIQDLIENVLTEKLRAREATLKQLQAQINPHFLYNCLGYIINMAQMKDEEAVVSMAYNLSAYYRYTTRMEQQSAVLKDEVQLLVNYLDIQKLRNGRIHYHIDIPEEMLVQRVPRLLLQPIVENAVIHGVGKSYTAGEIRISGEMSSGFCRIYVDDDGPGLEPDMLDALNHKMHESLQEEMGCGLWNTNQRLMHQFGENSNLTFKKSACGGFRTEIVWEIAAEEQQSQHTTTPGGKTIAVNYR
ncbi:sensor histidine kinase [Paenibacillus marinisediminis]